MYAVRIFFRSQFGSKNFESRSGAVLFKMNALGFTWFVLLWPLLLASASPKRGLALNSETICDDLKLFDGMKPWFYGWGRSPKGTQYPSCAGKFDAGFVPMY